MCAQMKIKQEQIRLERLCIWARNIIKWDYFIFSANISEYGIAAVII